MHERHKREEMEAFPKARITILQAINKAVDLLGGQPIRAKLKLDGQMLIYKVTLLKDGRQQQFRLNAMTGEPLDMQINNTDN